MKKIIIDGAGGPAGLNFINSLLEAPEKMELIGTDVNKFHLAWLPLEKKVLFPKCDEGEYISKLNKLIEKTNANFIHAQPDGQVLLLSENREKIKAKTFLPSKETIRICQDKKKSSKIWQKCGLLKNDSMEISNEKDIDDAESFFGYPYWVRASMGNSSRGSTLVRDKKTAWHWISYWRSRKIDWKFIAQEYFGGKNIAFQSLWKDGEMVMSQARERLEYLYPSLAPSGITNTPVVAVTISRDDINQVATEAVTAIDDKATGIFCVDLREDENGIVRPTEINVGRFFTTSYFFTKAGINMPYFYVKLAFGEEIPKTSKFNILPDGLYWIRHIDAPAVLQKENEFLYETIN